MTLTAPSGEVRIDDVIDLMAVASRRQAPSQDASSGLRYIVSNGRTLDQAQFDTLDRIPPRVDQRIRTAHQPAG